MFLNIKYKGENTDTMMYVASNVTRTYISLNECINLKLINKGFPQAQVGVITAGGSGGPRPQGLGRFGSPPQATKQGHDSAIKCTNDGVKDSECGCPRREKPPADKPTPPVPLTSEHTGEL